MSTRRIEQAGGLGAFLLGAALLAYAYYELVLWPGAGFPTRNVEVILAGAPTLRIGHLIKFADALALMLLAMGGHERLRAAAPLAAQLATIAAIVSVTLFLASGMLGLNILLVAQRTYALDPSEAITTIYLRTVTQALFDAAATAAGCFGLIFSLGALLARRLPRPLAITGVAFGALFAINRLLTDDAILVAVVLAVVWCFWLGVALWRANSGTREVAMATA